MPPAVPPFINPWLPIGLGVIAGSIILFFVLLRLTGKSFSGCFGLTALGCVILIAGLVSSSKPYHLDASDETAALASHPHNFAINLPDIQHAVLSISKRATRAADLKITMISGKTLSFRIVTPDDLMAAESLLKMRLGLRFSTQSAA
jgi:hypothetical protein